MKRTMRWAGVGLVFSLGMGVAGVQAQQPVAAEPQAPSGTVQAPREVVPPLPVPRLVKFAGTLKDEQGKARTGVVGVTFAVYKEQEGGAALWLETQNVELDEQGRYTVLLGSSKSEGLPLELFTAGEPRWLGVQVNLTKEVEQSRVLLVSVPYALKASDADTLGGKPLSSFVLASPATGSGRGVGTVFPTAGPIGTATIGGGGTQNFVAKFDSTGTNVINSSIFDTGTNVGIGTSSPARTLHLKSSAPTIRLEDANLPNSFWELQQSAFVLDTFGFLRYENGSAVADKSFVVSSAGNLGIGTGTPQRKLHIRSAAPVIRLEDTNLPNSFWELQQSAFFLDTFGFLRYENGAAVPTKSFVMSSAGNFGIGTGAPTQKLEVAGNVKISGTGNALTFPDGTVMTSAGAGTSGGTITGVNAGAGLTGGGTSGGVTLAINPSVVPQLGATTNTFSGSLMANSFTGSGAGLSNVNATMLGGMLPGAFATIGANTFSGNQSITGNIAATVGNFSANSSGPTLGVAQGGTGNGLEVTANSTSTGTEAVRGQVVAQNTVSFNTIGVHGITNSGGGRGVVGEATSGTTTAIGVQGLSSSDAGIGVSGIASAGGSTVGVQGEATAGPVSGNTIGVRGVSASNFGTGVQGEATSSSGFGVGVHGLLFGTTGTAGLFSAGPGATLILGQSSGINVFNVNSSGDVGASSYRDRVTGVNVGLATNCVTGQVMKWNGTTWNCSNDVSGITGVAAGAGLSASPANPITSSGTFSIATGGVTNSMLANSSVTLNAGTGLSGGGTVTLGNSLTLSNTGVLSFNGRSGLVTPTAGDYSFSQISGAATTAQLPAASLVRAITYLAGCDSCSPLTTADSQNTVFLNVIGGMTINSLTCFSDAGAPTINIQRNQAGTLTNVLSANLTCSTAGATSSSFSTSALSLNDSLNFIMATVDGVAKRATVIIKATVN